MICSESKLLSISSDTFSRPRRPVTSGAVFVSSRMGHVLLNGVKFYRIGQPRAGGHILPTGMTFNGRLWVGQISWDVFYFGIAERDVSAVNSKFAPLH